jgi:hypothetical protein
VGVPFFFGYTSSNNYDSDNEKIHCTPTNSTIHNFLSAPNIMDCENTIHYIAPNQKFHPLGLFKYKHSKKLIFPTLFYGQLQQFSKGFPY